VAFDVVIAGGGFGGLYAARRLERRLPRHSARITVVSDASSDLGQLRHPPSLGDYVDDLSRAGETPEQ
jgi:NADH dehydrogenase FAD-containing subunit